ncbi:TIGR02597 family protein [Verrucomicrobiaceae bacterium N1E253]|uniref:TIGR02597 family protein n=1 Tax=Oceaniferula marina TaxID=2748318 RepID=A0A851GH60_9BACT|nr:TIGR02597 family protein [Oceaniferula marina]NWK56222.1 TIGR02597 family protein [Oceaniferula marina]
MKRALKLRVLTSLILPLSLGTSLQAQTTTDPVGVVKITIDAAPSEGASKLTAISATLRNSISHQGSATAIGSFGANVQTLETGVTTWTADQWTTEAHLCYIENAAGAEEAYLITSMDESTGQLTLSTTFDLTARYTATPTFRIVKAWTLGSLFGTDAVPFATASSPTDADNVYAWDGSAWITYFHNGSSWQSPATSFGGDANDTVIFPDEGLLVMRKTTTDVTITINGSVPIKPQISTIPGNGLTFISTRYPVGTTLVQTNIHNHEGWTSASSPTDADIIYIWNNTSNSWTTYWHNGSSWQSPATSFGGNANDEAIAADSAMFIYRKTEASAENAGHTHPMPYTPN